MKRIIWHWTAGAPGVIPMEADAYHYVIQPDGRVVEGVPVEKNIPPLVNGTYAAHTLNANSWAIGIACDAMAFAKERPFSWGTNPLTEAQIESMLRLSATLCRSYHIPVSRTTTLTHAEVERSLGIKQRNKWDIMVLPGDAAPRDPIEVGDELRARLRAMLGEDERPVKRPSTQKPAKPKAQPVGWVIALIVMAALAVFVLSQ